VRLSAGGGLGQMRTNLFPATSRGEYQVVDHRFSWFLGGSAAHKFSGPLSFSTGLYWSRIAGHDEYWQQDKMIREADRQVHYLCLPMMVHVSLHGFQFGAGYQLGVPVVQSGTFSTYPFANGFGNSSIQETNDLVLTRTDMGVVGELGHLLSDRFDLGVRYYRSLQSVKDPRDGYSSPLYNEQLVLTLSYRILPKRKPKEVGSPVQQPVLSE